MEKARDTRRAGTAIPEERDRNGLLASPKAPRGSEAEREATGTGHGHPH